MERKCSHKIIWLLLGLAVLILTAAPALAAEPPSKPMLRIEAGMHTALIQRLATDAAGRYLVTASHDKTARVWDLASGRLLRVLRPPIGNGDEGKLNAVAMSPDGELVACAGWSGWNWDRTHSIYVMARSTGRLVRRITGLPNVLFDLAWSGDGRYLAVSMWGTNGVRVYETRGWSLVGQDRDYQSNCYGLSFDQNNRLAATAWDGYVRLYDSSFQRLVKVKALGGDRPYGVAFSPDGSLVAVGYDGVNRVDVLSGQDLRLLYSADTSQLSGGSLLAVAWSADGERLCAGGQYFSDGGRPVVCWSRRGRGSLVKNKVARNTVLDLLPLPRGGVVLAAADPGWAVVNGRGARELGQGPPIVDARDAGEHFRLSHDGSQVEFGYKVWGKELARFDLAQRRLARITGHGQGMSPPRLTAPGLNVTGWEHTYHPKLGGKALPLKQYETSRSLAVMPDGSGFLLGTDWRLRFYDRQGKERWQVVTPGVAWAVNIAPNGQVCVAALGDGTIRWYRVLDGQELLALFPHADQKRWVLWSPSGYYDASPGGEDLIGWHVNRGKDQAADFFGASRMRSAFYRPDVVSRMLATGDETRALAQANEDSNRRQEKASARRRLPPVVSILAPSDNSAVSSRQVTLRYSLRSPSGEPITQVKVLVDGRPLEGQRGLSVRPGQGGQRSLSIQVPPRDVAVSLIAANRFAASEPATVRLRWQGSRDKPKEFVIKPKLYVLAIGVSDYQDSSLQDLKYAAKDAKDFARVLRSQRGKLYREVVVRELTDRVATRGATIDGLDWLERETTAHDVAMVLLAGHGVNDKDNVYYFLPSDARLERLRRTGVPFSEIKRTVASLAGKTLFFIDTCHSGNALGGRRRGGVDINAVVNELASAENGAVVFTSAMSQQFALENDSWGNGAFTKAVVEGLSGRADFRHSGTITVNMLNLYISERVKQLTKGLQTPTSARPNTISDFPIALVR